MTIRRPFLVVYLGRSVIPNRNMVPMRNMDWQKLAAVARQNASGSYCPAMAASYR